MSKYIIIDGSHRTGNTTLINNFIKNKIRSEILFLREHLIESYNYEGKYSDDDKFISLMENITKNNTHIIWTTPMYWYSMSSCMKVFLDRFTDLLKTNKDIGRQLRGKSMSLIYNSNGTQEDYFEQPFKNTAQYLGMKFITALHINMGEGEINQGSEEKLIDFINHITI